MGARFTKSGDNPRPPRDSVSCSRQYICSDYGEKCNICKNNQLRKRSYFELEKS